MEVKRDTFAGVGIAYYLGEQSALITSDRKTIRAVKANDFDFSTSEILYTDYAESCSVVVLSDGKSWGLYHGYQMNKLGEFLKGWSLLKNSSLQHAFLFGSCYFGNFDLFVEERRGSVSNLLDSVLGISRPSQYIQWNTNRESSIGVAVEPLAKIIRVNLNL